VSPLRDYLKTKGMHMKKIDRRTMLRGLAMTSGALVGGCSSTPPGKNEQAKGAAVAITNVFAVILHGLAGTVFRNDLNPPRLHILIPEVMGHVYGIGVFKDESMLYGNYALDVPGNLVKDFKPYENMNAVLHIPKFPSAFTYRNLIDLPLPDFSTATASTSSDGPRLRVAKKKTGSPFFEKGPDPAEMALLHAFCYKYDPSSPPTLTSTSDADLKWDAKKNLHIWATPAFSDKRKHTGAATHHFEEAVTAFVNMFPSTER